MLVTLIIILSIAVITVILIMPPSGADTIRESKHRVPGGERLSGPGGPAPDQAQVRQQGDEGECQGATQWSQDGPVS